MRVHELAKQLGTTSKDLMARLHELGVDVKNHMSALDPDVVAKVSAPKASAPPAKPAKETAPAAPPAPAAAPAAPPPAKPAVPAAPVAPAAKPAAPVTKPPAPAPDAARPAAPAARPAAPAAAPRPPAPAGRPAPAAPRPVIPPRARPPAPVAKTPAPASAMAPVTAPPPAAPAKTVTIKASIVVRELAELMGMRPNQIISELMSMNILASINERLDGKVAQQIAERHGFAVEREKRDAEHHPPQKKEIEAPVDAEDRPEDLVPRAPVVTFLGHVDHGKTSLLDAIRKTQVVLGEDGGITQHIGASTVEVEGRAITFLDTPGHQAFTAMRARGANLTDIAVIVIAADDGIMPQTEEAIKHARAAEVPIVVAVNKCDLPAANVERVKQQLGAIGLTPEEWGGEVICAEVSATTRKGVDHLLEMLLLQADMLELRANPTRRARGYVIEAQLEPGMGPTMNLLVQNGTLHVGDSIVVGQHWGRVRALINDHGVKLKSAGPSVPVKCLGLPAVPPAGAEFVVCANDRAARQRAEEAESLAKAQQVSAPRKASLESLYEMLKETGRLELRVIVKADVQGSVEAIEHSLREIKSDKVMLNVVMTGVGNITTSDVLLASASSAIVFQFRVGKEEGVSKLAKREGIEIRQHDIIYDLIDEVRAAMAGLLTPDLVEKVVGHAEVLKVFSLSRGTIAGSRVTDGRVTPRMKVRVIRDTDTLYDGPIVSLRRFENDVSEVREGQECGIRLENFSAVAEKDKLEFYEVEKVMPKL